MKEGVNRLRTSKISRMLSYLGSMSTSDNQKSHIAVKNDQQQWQRRKGTYISTFFDDHD